MANPNLLTVRRSTGIKLAVALRTGQVFAAADGRGGGRLGSAFLEVAEAAECLQVGRVVAASARDGSDVVDVLGRAAADLAAVAVPREDALPRRSPLAGGAGPRVAGRAVAPRRDQRPAAQAPALHGALVMKRPGGITPKAIHPLADPLLPGFWTIK